MYISIQDVTLSCNISIQDVTLLCNISIQGVTLLCNIRIHSLKVKLAFMAINVNLVLKGIKKHLHTSLAFHNEVPQSVGKKELILTH